MEEDQEQNRSYVCKFYEQSLSSLALISAIKKQSITEHDQDSINGGMGVEFDEETITKSEYSGANSYGLRENPKKSCSNSKSKCVSNLICKQCGKVFHSLRAHLSHTRTHSLKSEVSIKKNICTKCGKGFDSMKALYGHMKCHAMKKSQPSNQPSSSSSSSQDGKLDGGVKEEVSNLIRKKRSCTKYKSTKHNDLSSFTSLSSFGSIGESNDDEVEEGALCLMMLSRGLGRGKKVISSECEFDSLEGGK